MREGNHPKLARWLAAILLVLPMFYVASFGPVCWLWGHECVTDEVMFIASRPVAWCIPHSPPQLRAAIFWWGTLGGGSDIALFFMLH